MVINNLELIQRILKIESDWTTGNYVWNMLLMVRRKDGLEYGSDNTIIKNTLILSEADFYNKSAKYIELGKNFSTARLYVSLNRYDIVKVLAKTQEELAKTMRVYLTYPDKDMLNISLKNSIKNALNARNLVKSTIVGERKILIDIDLKDAIVTIQTFLESVYKDITTNFTTYGYYTTPNGYGIVVDRFQMAKIKKHLSDKYYSESIGKDLEKYIDFKENPLGLLWYKGKDEE